MSMEPMKPVPEFTIEELLAQLSRKEVGTGGFTIREICKRKGLPPTDTNMRKIRRVVNDWRALGKWEIIGWRSVYYPAMKTNRDVACYGPKKTSKEK